MGLGRRTHARAKTAATARRAGMVSKGAMPGSLTRPRAGLRAADLSGPLPPCGGGLGWGVDRNSLEERVFGGVGRRRGPPTPPLPRKGGGSIDFVISVYFTLIPWETVR